MSRRLLLLVVLLLSVAVPAWRASACEGSEIVFEDKFHDDAGGWSIKDTVEVKDGAFTFKLPPDDMQSNLNVTFTVKDAVDVFPYASFAVTVTVVVPMANLEPELFE